MATLIKSGLKILERTTLGSTVPRLEIWPLKPVHSRTRSGTLGFWLEMANLVHPDLCLQVAGNPHVGDIVNGCAWAGLGPGERVVVGGGADQDTLTLLECNQEGCEPEIVASLVTYQPHQRRWFGGEMEATIHDWLVYGRLQSSDITGFPDNPEDVDWVNGDIDVVVNAANDAISAGTALRIPTHWNCRQSDLADWLSEEYGFFIS